MHNPMFAAILLTLWTTANAAAQFGPLPPAGCRSVEGRTRVLLLGSYHMSNPGLDRFNLEADDVLVAGRQREIQAVVDGLARFLPTKVAVEAPWGDTATVRRYRDYVGGVRELRRSEEEQIGFRLASQLGLETIYPIDVRMPLDDEALGPLIAANPRHGARLARLDETGRAAMELMGSWLATGTIGDMLYNMNRPDMLPYAHQPYIEVFVPIVEGDDYAGADMVAIWFQRNLRIFANLTRVAHSPNDRIFVVYGAGHVPLLRDFVTDHPDYCVEDPLPYLPTSR